MRTLTGLLTTRVRTATIAAALILGPLTASAQPFTKALSFGDGNAGTLDDDFATLPSLTQGLNGSFTMEAWVYWRGGNGSFPRIFEFGNDGNNFIFLTAAIPFGSTGPRFAIVSGGAVQVVDATTTLPINAWSHITITVDGTNDVGTMYLNGTAVGTSTGFTLRPSSLGTTSGNWLGGRGQYTDPYFDGIIEEFRISNSVRYSANFTPPTGPFAVDANTVALYHFDEGTGQTSAEATSSFGNAVLGATTTAESTDPSWVPMSTLPVRLNGFSAASSGNAVDVKWTASLDDAGSFDVERSADGRRFVSVNTISRGSATNGLQNFTFRDDQPLPGRSYYRLKAVENGRAPVYSAIVPVNLSGREELLVFPNPVRGNSAIHLEFARGLQGMVVVELRNAAGLVVDRQQFQATSQRQLQLPRKASLPAGTYTVEVIHNGLRQARQVVLEQ